MIELVETHIGFVNIWSLNFLDTQKNSSGATIPLAGPRIPIFFTGPSIPIFLTGPWIPIFMSARGSLYSDRFMDPYISDRPWIPIFLSGPSILIFLTGPWIPIF